MLFILIGLLSVQEPTWSTVCSDVAFNRIKHKTMRSDKSANFVIGQILKGIEEYVKDKDLTEEQKLDLCLITFSTAEQETSYEFAIGAAGEVGMFQTKLNSLRMNRERITFINDYSDTSLTVLLLNHAQATKVFLVHFTFLYNNSTDLKTAWRKYNGCGEKAEQYSEQVFEKYLEIRSLQ